jgi:growth factor-regulated tyrosine kinase substrate
VQLTDTCVKNGGDHFLIEVASREFMDNLVSIIKSPVSLLSTLSADSETANRDVKSKTLEDIQVWALAFEGRPHLSYVKTVYNKLKSEGTASPLVLFLIHKGSSFLSL